MDTIRPITPLWETFPTSEAPQAKAESGSIFADIFQSVIEDVRQTDDEKNKQEYLLATGQLDNPAELTLAAYKATTAVNLLIQLRNGVLDAYNELTRISM